MGEGPEMVIGKEEGERERREERRDQIDDHDGIRPNQTQTPFNYVERER